MNREVDYLNGSQIERLSRILAAAVVLMGCTILIGWALDLDFLKSGFPGLQSTNVNEALAFILCGSSLWVSNSRRSVFLAQGLAMVAILLGLLTLGEHLFAWNLGLDQILIRINFMPASFHPGRMAPLACLNFVILGVSLFFLNSRPRMVQVLALLGSFLTLLGITSFFYHESWSTYGFLSYTQMPFLSSLAFLILCAGILSFRPELGFMVQVISRGPGGFIIRYLLFPLSIILFVLNWANMTAENAGYYEKSFGRAMTTLIFIFVLAGTMWWTARSLDAMDEKRRHSEESLRETKDYLNKLIDYANAPIIVWNAQRKITRFNKAFEQLTSYNAEEVLGKDPSMLFRMENKEDLLQKATSAVQGEQWQSVEIPVYKKSGEARCVLWSSANIFNESGELQAIIAHGQDITNRKRSEKELAINVHRLAILNRVDRVIFSSLDIEQAYGHFVEELKELVTIDMTYVIMLDESRKHWTVVMTWFGNEPIVGKGEWRDIKGWAIELVIAQKQPLVEREIDEFCNGTEKDLLFRRGIRSVTLLPLIIKDEVIGVLILASRQPAAYCEKDLDILRPLSDQFSLAMQNSWIYNEVKQQSLKLEKTVEERTCQLQKANEELEAFSYSVSHDLRAPLRGVDGFSRILLEEHISELSPDAQHYLTLVRKNAVQMGRLIDDLLTFSRTSRQELAKRSVDTAEMVRLVLEEQHGELEGREVEVIIGDLLPCQADPAMLKQVFFNLISNAIKYTRKKETARIEIGSFDRDGITTYFVKDDGVGFDMLRSGKLFGVFQRLHSESDFEGTGVGLALVQRIVRKHGGSIWAEAEVDKGATFYFALGGSEFL
jgi:PAS domain S-box-containing protein